MHWCRRRVEEDEIGKRIKREIDARRAWYIDNQNNKKEKEGIMGRRHMLGPPAASLNTITPCAACKLLRRRCAEECPFCPYFSPHEPHKFAAVHKVFGASNVSKMLMEVPESQRADAANSLVYEANVRLRDPVYGCMGAISALQQQVQTLQAELHAVRAEILKHKYREAAANTLLSAATAPPPPPPPPPPPSSNNDNNSLTTSAALPQQLQSPQPQQAPPPPPPATPPLSASNSVVVVSSSPTASLYTLPPPPSATAPGFPSLSTHHIVPFFD
ncbi:hypothetical protein Cgig2_011278 [Carnegiea gigantea]|uniref:LOB domain-containing protein n=1 Tax=Carnegiea gigantea TaxID=171969 RepID=A0A9Q1GVC6_9CARY|nr:hypothetical protein Cgig2_011278 [Carnegiea gigantea]